MADVNLLNQNNLLDKSVAMGVIRELPVDESYLFPSMCPLTSVGTDDVFFQYHVPEAFGIAPARAEDAEAVVVRRDDTAGWGRASIVDWALKDTYSASDVTRHREYMQAVEALQAAGTPAHILSNAANELSTKIARDNRRRRRALDARLEQLWIQALEFGTNSYDDGDVIFSVDYGRPAGQTTSATPTGTDWDDANGGHNPIGDLIEAKLYMYDNYGTTLGEAIMSEKTLWYCVNSTLFAQMDVDISDTVAGDAINARYAQTGYGLEKVKAKLEAATGIRIRTYDAGRRTRAWGSTTLGFQRFMTEGKVILLPRQEDINALDDTDFGFAAMLTSPHPEGGFTPGFYTWEETEVDPWRTTIGTGIKAFPVCPHMEYTFVFEAHTSSGSVGPWTQPGAPTP